MIKKSLTGEKRVEQLSVLEMLKRSWAVHISEHVARLAVFEEEVELFGGLNLNSLY
jgi:hypothetical protein